MTFVDEDDLFSRKISNRLTAADFFFSINFYLLETEDVV